jgi:hypothetical protein
VTRFSRAGQRVVVIGPKPEVVAALVDDGAEVHVIDRERPSIIGIASHTDCDPDDGVAVASAIQRVGAVLDAVEVWSAAGIDALAAAAEPLMYLGGTIERHGVVVRTIESPPSEGEVL